MGQPSLPNFAFSSYLSRTTVVANITAIFRLLLIFAKTVHTIRMKISTVIFYTIVWSMCAISINSNNWDWSESEGKSPKPTPLPHMRLWVKNLNFFRKSFIVPKNPKEGPCHLPSTFASIEICLVWDSNPCRPAIQAPSGL